MHFALTEKSVHKLKSFESERKRLEFLQNDLEDEFFAKHKEWLQQTDKAWDGIHRALTDGRLSWTNGSYPLNHVIMGGELLYTASDHILTLKTPEQVRDVAAALKGITKERLRSGYCLITAENCDWDTSDQDWEYTWCWFEDLPPFFEKAANADRYVVFSATQ